VADQRRPRRRSRQRDEDGNPDQQHDLGTPGEGESVEQPRRHDVAGQQVPEECEDGPAGADDARGRTQEVAQEHFGQPRDGTGSEDEPVEPSRRGPARDERTHERQAQSVREHVAHVGVGVDVRDQRPGACCDGLIEGEQPVGPPPQQADDLLEDKNDCDRCERLEGRAAGQSHTHTLGWSH
jgi:hypothetical protein